MCHWLCQCCRAKKQIEGRAAADFNCSGARFHVKRNILAIRYLSQTDPARFHTVGTVIEGSKHWQSQWHTSLQSVSSHEPSKTAGGLSLRRKPRGFTRTSLQPRPPFPIAQSAECVLGGVLTPGHSTTQLTGEASGTPRYRATTESFRASARINRRRRIGCGPSRLAEQIHDGLTGCQGL